jgi:hypothetical protein
MKMVTRSLVKSGKAVVLAALVALLVPMQASAATIVVNDVFPSGDLVHMWAITVDGSGQFSASTAGSGFYTDLFLFDAQWKGLQANGNRTPNYPNDYSYLPPVTLAPGNYFVAVAKAGELPYSAAGLIFPNVATGVLGPTGPGGGQPLAYWAGGDWASYDLGLTLTMTGIAPNPQPVGSVPEPASMTLIGTGLVGLASRLRKRQA